MKTLQEYTDEFLRAVESLQRKLPEPVKEKLIADIVSDLDDLAFKKIGIRAFSNDMDIKDFNHSQQVMLRPIMVSGIETIRTYERYLDSCKRLHTRPDFVSIRDKIKSHFIDKDYRRWVANNNFRNNTKRNEEQQKQDFSRAVDNHLKKGL